MEVKRLSSGAIYAVIVYVIMVLLITAASTLVSPPGARQGTARSLESIPAHLGELAAGGVLLGLFTSLVFKGLDLDLIAVTASVAILTDLDHIPAFMGLAQPIRPVHSIVFIALTIVLMAIAIRRPDIEAATASGFFVHLAIDTGLFPAFSPLSFAYYSLSSYQGVFIVAAVGSAALAGFLSVRRRGYGKHESSQAHFASRSVTHSTVHTHCHRF